MADNLKSLWKEYKEAALTDLPATEIKLLDDIIVLAGQKAKYGYLMKAIETRLECYRKISEDSLNAEIRRIEKTAADTDTNSVMYAFYNSLLGSIYTGNNNIYSLSSADNCNGRKNKAKKFFVKSLSNPQISSKYTAKNLYPYFSKDNRQNFLVILSRRAGMYDTARNYFINTGDRHNAFLMSLEVIRGGNSFNKPKKHIGALDSLINEYGDMDVCCEAAIAKYDVIRYDRKISVKEKINFIRESLKRWGSWENSNILRNAELELTCPSFDIEISKSQIAENKTVSILLDNVRNIKKITTRIWKTDLTTADVITPMSYYDHKMEFLKNAVKSTRHRDAITIENLFDAEDYEFSKIRFSTPKLRKGIYIIETYCNNKDIESAYNILYVSNLAVVALALPENRTRLAVVDITSGMPVSNAGITVRCRKDWNKYYKKNINCNADGEAVFTSDNDIEEMYAYAGDDSFMMPTNKDNRFYYHEDNDTEHKTVILTDRSIYRPGHTVHAAVTAYRSIKNEDLKADGNVKVKLKLTDANYKVIDERTVVTDAYGKASADFVLPKNTLTGTFIISSDRKGSTEIRVEEYKRPTFDVHFTKPDREYHFGDTLKVTARAESFAGVPLQGARVKYVIKRAYIPWLRYFAPDTQKTVSKGDTLTSADGSFSVDVALNAVSKDKWGIYYFIVEAEVTDAAGETQKSKIALPVSKRDAWIECDLPEKIEKSAVHSMKINVKNISNADIDTDVTFFIDDTKGYIVKAGTDINLDDKFAGLSSGVHKLTITALGEKIEKEFVLFSLEDKVPAVKSDEWMYVTSNTFPTDGGSVFLQLGTSFKNVHALYTVISGNRVLKSGAIELSNTVNTYELKYKEEYGRGIIICYAWVKNGRLFSNKVCIEKALPEKKLNIKRTTFRNRLVPGQEEKWTLNISGIDGIASDASMAATLYDMSLDNICSHEWEHVYGLSTRLPYTGWTCTRFNMKQNAYVNADIKYYDIKYYKNYGLHGVISCNDIVCDCEALPVTGTGSVSLRNSSLKMMNAVTGAAPDMRSGNAEDAPEDTGGLVETVPVLRENLNETAFFYPALTTDAEGNVSISFTLPESLTTWRFMAFANDKDMNNEVFTDNIVARKDLMIQPNMPRFVRHGDKAVISARISNLSEKDVVGTAHMHICNAETDEIIYKESCKFSLDKGATGSVSFSFDSNIGEDIVICKIFATGEDFSDGEQHYLCILSDRELVTNTLAVTMTDGGKASFDTGNLLSDKASDNRFTLEYTDAPEWFAIESLPSLALDNSDDAISIAKNIYANVMARHIASTSPATKKIIESMAADESGSSLTGSLQKNEELKDIILAETPWINEAESETERMRRLGELFDQNLMTKRISTAVTKLRDNQLADGSWSWWKGMRGSRYITVTVTEMLLRINAMTTPDYDMKYITDRALKYLAKDAKEEIESKKDIDEYFITPFGIKYLYLRSFADIKDDATTKILVKKLLELSPGNMDIYEKSMTAVVLFRKGYKDKALELMRSVKEYSVYKSDMGRFFDSEAAAYSWCDYKIPSQVMAIEALSEVYPEDIRTIDEMKQWLLNEKRTTSWDTPINSVNAIYALTKGGSAIAQTKEKSTIKINGKNIVPTIPETGYVKTSEKGSRFDIEIDKKSEGTSWLSMYGSYTADIKDVKGASTGLMIKREIKSADGKDITVGSKVKVTITITADRDYDFVQVTDRRAACMEPVNQISGYNGRYYCSMKDNAAYYYFDMMPKGTHVIETEYYIDRTGSYSTGLCKVQCAYAPEYCGRTEAEIITVK